MCVCVLYYKFILYITRGAPSKAVKKRKNKTIRESSFNIENGNEDVGGGGEFVCVFGVFEKSVRSRERA